MTKLRHPRTCRGDLIGMCALGRNADIFNIGNIHKKKGMGRRSLGMGSDALHAILFCSLLHHEIPDRNDRYGGENRKETV